MAFASILPGALALFTMGLQTAGELPKVPQARHCPIEITALRNYEPGTNRTSMFNLFFNKSVVGFSGRFYGLRAVAGPGVVIRPCNKRTLASAVNLDPHDVCAPETADPNPDAEFFYAVKKMTEFHPISGMSWGDLHLAYPRWFEFDEIDFEGYKWKSSSKSTCAFVLENPSPEDRKRSVMQPRRPDPPPGPPRRISIDHN